MSCQLADTGFAAPAGARQIVQRLALQCALKDARASAQTLLDLLHKHVEALAGDRPVEDLAALRLATSDLQSRFARTPIFGADSDAVRKHQLLEGVELLIELLGRFDVEIRQGLFSCSSEEEASELGESGHRLCGGVK